MTESRKPYPQHLYPGCPCYNCDSKTWEPFTFDDGTQMTFANRMSLCPTCGNKRCPGAMNHENDCSGSNAPGQKSSRYEKGSLAETNRNRLAFGMPILTQDEWERL